MLASHISYGHVLLVGHTVMLSSHRIHMLVSHISYGHVLLVGHISYGHVLPVGINWRLPSEIGYWAIESSGLEKQYKSYIAFNLTEE